MYISKLNNREGLWLAGGASLDLVSNLEEAFGVILPETYKEFLLELGSLSIGDISISGITCENLDDGGGSVLSDTLYFQKDYDLPENLIVIQPDEDAPYCLDTTDKNSVGEMSVVCFEIQSGEQNQIADNFEDWFFRYFLTHIKR